MVNQRPQLEQQESAILASYAHKSALSRGRVHPEPESSSRTAFQRDRDRIIHTTAFRRLMYKTQVFVNYEGDHYRTRLTHTLEVAQLGRSLARALGANEDLTEAICLAHDLGHPPFGHAGEQILNQLMSEHGGFNHNTQSYRIVTELEQRYPGFPGLNLTFETREGMIKHETSYDKSEATGYEPEKRASLEAQIANLADEIAYNAHDLDDGLRAGLFSADALCDLELWRELTERAGWFDGVLDDITRHGIIRELIGLAISDVVAATEATLSKQRLDTLEQLQLHHSNVVGYSPEIEPKVVALKDFLYQQMYRHYRLVRMQIKAERFLAELFEAYVKVPAMLPQAVQARLNAVPVQQVVTDYIAGMTDRFALDEWQRLFVPYSPA